MTVVDRFLEQDFRRAPVTATFTGIHDFDGRLPDWSPQGLEASVGEMRGLRRDLAAEPPDGGPAARIDHLLADAALDIQIAEIEGPRFQRGNPSLWVGEAAFGIVSLVTREFAPIEARWPKVVDRLEAIPGFLRAARATIDERPVPERWIARAVRECEGATLLAGPGLATLAASAPPPSADVRDRLEEASRASVAAFSAFARWLQHHVVMAPRERLACGGDFFDFVLARGHWCRRARADLLRDAREALEAEGARLDEMATREDPAGWPGVEARLAADHPAPGEYLPAFDRVWRACRDAAERHGLVTWPDAPIRYVPIPDHTRDAAPLLYYLSYRSPAPFDPLPIHDYEVAPVDAGLTAAQQDERLRACNHAVIALNHVIHHGGLGHHVQNAFASRSMSRIGQVAAVDAASRIGLFCGGTMAEGWACYASGLMEEIGFLTPLQRVAEQHGRVRQLARAVIDIALHEGTMNDAEAEAYYVDQAYMTPPAARAEVTKNTMFPGAAVMYWLGTRQLQDLRAARARADGAAFTLRGFHDRVLSHGSIPVAMVARLMDGEDPA